MATLVELTTLITAWGEARGIVANSTPFAQACKTHEEVCELLEADVRIRSGEYDYGSLMDAIGDVYVTLIMVCACNKSPITGFEYDGHSDARDAASNPRPVKTLCESVSGLFLACANAGLESSQTVHLESVEMIGWLRDVCSQYDLSLTECVEQAYEEIKDRKGYLRPDGVFVKEAT